MVGSVSRWRVLTSRAIKSVITLWILATLIWLMFRLLPGDPTTALLGTGQLPPDASAQLRAE